MKLFGLNTRTIKVWIFENVVDFVGIFISIILAFSLENWDERNKELEKEAIYLASMYENIRSDIGKLEVRMQDEERKIEACLTIKDMLERGFMERKDSIMDILGKELDYFTPFIPDNSTFESLKFSGDLRLITNSNFKILLSELDKKYNATSADGNELIQYINGDQWRGFVLDKVNLETKTALDTSSDFQVRLYNRINYLYKLHEIYYYSLLATHTKVSDVISALEEEMTAKDVVYTKLEDQSVDIDQ